MNKLLDFAEALGLNLDWSEGNDSVTATINNSNNFSSIYAKINNNSGCEVANEELTATESNFEWNYYEDNSDVPSYYIQLEGNFDNDTYEVTVWQK